MRPLAYAYGWERGFFDAFYVRRIKFAVVPVRSSSENVTTIGSHPQINEVVRRTGGRYTES